MSNPYENDKNNNKDYCNQKFCNQLKNVLEMNNNVTEMNNNVKKPNLIILDGKNMRTTNFLVKYNNINKNNIISIERDKEISDIHKKNGIKSVCSDIKNYEGKDTDKPIIALYFDTCGTTYLQGNEIIQFLKNNLILNKYIKLTPFIIFSYTFSKRGHSGKGSFTNTENFNTKISYKKKGKIDFNEENKKFFKKIKSIFKKIGYSLTNNNEDYEYDYRSLGNNKKSSNMYFRICNFKLNKVESNMTFKNCMQKQLSHNINNKRKRKNNSFTKKILVKQRLDNQIHFVEKKPRKILENIQYKTVNNSIKSERVKKIELSLLHIHFKNI